MSASRDNAEILRIIDSYTKALDSGDAALWESLYWLDDPAFSEIENDRPYFLDRSYIQQISAMLRKRGPATPNQRWYDTNVHILSPNVAYSVSLRDELNTKTTSRVTLVYLKKEDEWRIIHAHMSDVPK